MRKRAWSEFGKRVADRRANRITRNETEQVVAETAVSVEESEPGFGMQEGDGSENFLIIDGAPP